jgi:hypothetical protein
MWRNRAGQQVTFPGTCLLFQRPGDLSDAQCGDLARQAHPAVGQGGGNEVNGAGVAGARTNTVNVFATPSRPRWVPGHTVNTLSTPDEVPHSAGRKFTTPQQVVVDAEQFSSNMGDSRPGGSMPPAETHQDGDRYCLQCKHLVGRPTDRLADLPYRSVTGRGASGERPEAREKRPGSPPPGLPRTPAPQSRRAASSRRRTAARQDRAAGRTPRRSNRSGPARQQVRATSPKPHVRALAYPHTARCGGQAQDAVHVALTKQRGSGGTEEHEHQGAAPGQPYWIREEQLDGCTAFPRRG